MNSISHTKSPDARWRAFVNLLGWLSASMLLLTFFVVDPLAHDDAYMTPKWAWIAIAAGLGGVSLLARFLSGRPVMFPFDEIWIAVLAFVIWNWTAISWARSRSLAFDRAGHLSFMLLALLCGIQWLRTRRMLLRVAWAFLAIGAVTAVWVLIEDYVRSFWPQHIWIHPNLSDWRGYLSAGLGNTNHIGDLLALMLLPAVIMFGEARRTRTKLMLAFLSALFAAALIVCYSVGSNLGLITGALVMVCMMLWRSGPRWFTRRWPRLLALLIAWSAVVAYFNIDTPINPHHPGILKEGFGSTRWAEGGPTREVIWAEALEMIRLHPLLGVGPGNFTYVFPEMDSPLIAGRPDLMVYQGLWTNAAHNEILQTWSELGIGGLFLLIVLCALAYYHLFRHLNEADPLGFRIRVALAGLFTCYIFQAQMNFTLQHPAGLLIFFGLLLAIIAEKRTRPREGGIMPPLRWETDWLALQVDWHSMKKPTGLGAALLIPKPVAQIATLLLLAGWIAFAACEIKPVRAQHNYRLGVMAEQFGDPAAAEAYFKRALEIYPNATDCRSHYSDWLVKQHRPQEALVQLKIVRERLNSNELWLREAAADDELGNHAAAQAARATAVQRVWSLRNRS